MHRLKTKKPRIVTAGFCALDVVFGVDDPSPRFYAGGTSGNVAAGLAYCGWESIPLARLADDAAGRFVRDDLARWGVDTSHLNLKPVAPTPIVVEKIYTNKTGIPKHRFLWNCPDCGAYFPPYKAVLRTQLEALKEIQTPNVFYADRVSRSTIELAQYFRGDGALVYFEPSAAGDPKLFKEMLGLCDVLKYSAQRARSFSELLRHHKAHLEIETLGEEGLRYRMKGGAWKASAAFDVEVKDTAGGGDWTTVGIIAFLMANSTTTVGSISRKQMQDALKYGQALAALNCQFEGPRGAMYQLSSTRFKEAVRALEAQLPEVGTKPSISFKQQLSTSAICPSCRPKEPAETPEGNLSAVSITR